MQVGVNEAMQHALEGHPASAQNPGHFDLVQIRAGISNVFYVVPHFLQQCE